MNSNGYLEVMEDLEAFEDLELFEDDDDDEAYETFGEYDDDDDEAYDYLTETLYALEDDDDDEAAERRRRRRKRRRYQRPRRPRTASRRAYYRPRVSSKKYVTQAQMQASLNRVRKDVTKNARAVKTVNSQLRSHVRQANKVTQRQDRSIARARKTVAGVKDDLKQVQQTSMLLQLLQKPPELTVDTQEITVGSDNVTVVTGVTQQENTDNLLPILLMTGMGSGSKDDSSNMLLLALAISGGL